MVRPVAKRLFAPLEPFPKLIEQYLGLVAVIEVRRRDNDADDEAHCINNDVSLASVHFLVAVDALVIWAERDNLP